MGRPIYIYIYIYGLAPPVEVHQLAALPSDLHEHESSCVTLVFHSARARTILEGVTSRMCQANWPKAASVEAKAKLSTSSKHALHDSNIQERR